MNTTEMAAKLADLTGMPKTAAKKAVDSMVSIIADAIVAGDEVALPGLGKLMAVHKPERQGRNPATGETITIAATRKATFKAGKPLKDRLV